ncbi:Replicase polyprotein 1a [Linum perenne]
MGGIGKNKVGYVHAYLNGDADVGAVNLYTWKELTDHISDIDEELEDIPIVRRRQGKRKRKSGGDGEASTSKEELDVKGKKVKKLKVKVEDNLRKGKEVVKRMKGGIVDDSSTDFKKSVKKLKGWHTLDVNLGLISTKEIGESKKAEIHNLIEVCVGAAANQKLKDVDQHISTLQSSSSSSSTEESSPEASSTDSNNDESDGGGAKTKDAGGKDSNVQVIKSSSDGDFEEEMNPSDKRKRTKKVVTSKRDVSKGKGVDNTRAPSSKKKDDGKITEEDDEDAEDEGKDDGKAGDDNDDKGGDDDHSDKDDGKDVDNTQAPSSKKKDDGKITDEDDEDAENEGKDDGKAVEDEGKDDGKVGDDNDSHEDDDDHSNEDDDNDGGATATGDTVDPEGESNADANVNTTPRNSDSVVDERRPATTPSKTPDVLINIGSLLCSPSVVNSVIEETVKQIATEHPPSPIVNVAAGGVQDSSIEKVIVHSTGCSDTYSTDGRKNSMPVTSSFSFSDFRAKIYQYATSKDLAGDEILVKLKG